MPADKIVLRGANREFFASTEHECLCSGPGDCVAGETIIEGTGKTIKWLCDNNVAPIVQTLLGPRRAGVPFLKGRDGLYEVVTDDGRRFKATAKHRVLTERGYVFVASLRHGEYLRGYASNRHQSILDTCQSTHASDVRRSPDTILNCQDRCSPCLQFSCDEQLPLAEDTDQAFSPSQPGVPVLDRACYNEDDPAYKAARNHPCQSFFRRANGHSCLQKNPCSAPIREDACAGIYGQLSGSCQSALRFVSETAYALRQAGELILYFAHMMVDFSDFPCRDYTITSSIITSIKECGYDDFYDLTVPDAHHYFAHGTIHHNTGKTFTMCLKIHATCTLIPKTQVLICRKYYSSLVGTIVKTFQNTIEGQPVRAYGGETPSRFIYPNGSVVWLGGLDNSQAFLSGWFDVVAVNQTEEITEDDWEMIASRCTGRNAVVKYPQLIGDPNPGSRTHWILERAKQGRLRLLKSTHKDNPSLYDDNGNITEDGIQRIGNLENTLSGIRRKRLLDGLWVTAEGVVFDTFNPDFHCIERDDKEFVVWYLCQDEGYTNPAVVLLVGVDSDGRWHVAREFYKTGVAEIDVVEVAKEWNKEKLCEASAVDEAGAGLIAALINAGVNAIGGKGRLLDGILALQNRLKVNKGDVSLRFPDGRPRLTISPSLCPQTVNEFESYVWKPGKDIPVDEFNHSISALRYLHDVLVTGTGMFNNNSKVHAPPVSSSRLKFQMRKFIPRRY